jgi:hypothetical protein
VSDKDSDVANNMVDDKIFFLPSVVGMVGTVFAVNLLLFL